MLGKKDEKPKEDEKPDTSPIVCGQFTVQLNLPAGQGNPQRALTFNGYVYYGEDESSISDRLDLFHRLIDRQKARYEVPELEGKLEMMQKHLEDALKAIEEHEARAGSTLESRKLSSQERQNLTNMKKNLPLITAEIEKGHRAILAAKVRGGLLNGAAAPDK